MLEIIRRFSLVMFLVLILTVFAVCTIYNVIEDNEVKNSNDYIGEEEDEITEKDLVERILKESNKNNDRLLKEGGYYLSIDFFDEYRQESFIEENEENIEVITRVDRKSTRLNSSHVAISY